MVFRHWEKTQSFFIFIRNSTALRMKGETVDEIAGAATIMRSKASKINPKIKEKEIHEDDLEIKIECPKCQYNIKCPKCGYQCN